MAYKIKEETLRQALTDENRDLFSLALEIDGFVGRMAQYEQEHAPMITNPATGATLPLFEKPESSCEHPSFGFGINGNYQYSTMDFLPITLPQMLGFIKSGIASGKDLYLEISLAQRRAEVRLDLQFEGDESLVEEELPKAMRNIGMRKPRQFADCFRSFYTEAEGIGNVLAMYNETPLKGFRAALQNIFEKDKIKTEASFEQALQNALKKHNIKKEASLLAYDLANVFRQDGKPYYAYQPPGLKGEYWPDYGTAKYSMRVCDRKGTNYASTIGWLEFSNTEFFVGQTGYKPSAELKSELELIAAGLDENRIRCRAIDWYDYVITLDGHLFRYGQIDCEKGLIIDERKYSP